MNEPEPAALSMALRGWLACRFGGQVDEAAQPSRAAGGRDYATYFVHFGGQHLPALWTGPLVARLTPVAGRYEALRREARLQGWCADQGFPAPAVLAVVPPGEVAEGPVEVMRRLSGTTVADAIAEGRAGLIDRLAALLADLHCVPVPSWAPQDDPAWSVAERRLALARFVVGKQADEGLLSALRRVEGLVPSLEVPNPVVCHGDFHPYNVLVDGDQLGVIDWTDAGTGDRHADLSWATHIFEMAALSSASNWAPEALRGFARSFLAAYTDKHAVEPARLARWRPVHLLHEWAMTAAEAKGLWGTSTTATGGSQDRSEWLRDELEAAMRGI
jgi:aminoglycoside phosphotransferase (APT) family kinase protein